MQPVFPWSLRFKPTGNINFPASKMKGSKDFRKELATIPAGSVLYDVYAMNQPAELGGKETLIGSIVLKTVLTTSNWGDEHMYFRHQRMDDDFVYKPEWEPYAPKYGGFFSLEQEIDALEELHGQKANGCPFANLMMNLNN